MTLFKSTQSCLPYRYGYLSKADIISYNMQKNFHKKCFYVPIGCLATLADHGTNAISQALRIPIAY